MSCREQNASNKVDGRNSRTRLDIMHERNHGDGHIPPPDLPQHKRVLGFRRHHVVGVFILIAILLLYLLLLVRRGVWLPTRHAAAPTAQGVTPNSPLKV
jgi:hypothetical protein